MAAALAGILGGRTQREAIKAMGAVLTNPRTALQAVKFYGQVTGELGANPGRRRRTRTTAARPVTITWHTSYDPKTGAGREVGVSLAETELNQPLFLHDAVLTARCAKRGSSLGSEGTSANAPAGNGRLWTPSRSDVSLRRRLERLLHKSPRCLP